MFKKKNPVGVFFGPHGVSIVETTNRGKIKNHSFSLFPQDITKPSGAAIPRDSIFNVFMDNEEEIIAFMSKALREARIDIDNSELIVCVPNRDLIVRFFEIPPIPRKEIDTSISFEIKKYIPFRTEDIVYDYQIQIQKNIIEVLFAGIKKEEIEKYKNILTKLKVNVLAIEPSQFSLLRLLKIEKIISSKESVVIVELEKGDSAISIVDNSTPCFSRDVKISGASETTELDTETLSFRLVNEVRVSIDYFRRQFLKKGIDKIIVLSKQESKELINNFNKELGITVQYKSTDSIFGSKEEYSLNLAKAMGASFRMYRPSSLVINLSKQQKTPTVSGGLVSPQQMIREVFQEIIDIPRLTIIKTLAFAIVLLLGIFLYGNFKLGPVKQELARISSEANSKLTGDIKGFNESKLSSFKKQLKSSVDVYKTVFEREFLISEKLLALTELLPEGVWLEQIQFDRNNRLFVLKVVVYIQDEKKASDAPYAFVSNLKQSPLFSKNVNSISVTSLRSSFIKENKVNKFDVEIKLNI